MALINLCPEAGLVVLAPEHLSRKKIISTERRDGGVTEKARRISRQANTESPK